MGEETVRIQSLFPFCHLPSLGTYTLTPTNPSKSYNEMLFMIDTCQANTLYSRFYSPNIIATGSSALDQSSYSHHADNDVGVAVIDRYTYYNLDFLESQVTSPGSKLTLGNLFDSYDESKIHSQPGIRWDLFEGGERAGRERLVMDFFGNVQGVEVEQQQQQGIGNESDWREDLRRLGEIMRRRRKEESEETRNPSADESATKPLNPTSTLSPRSATTRPGAAKVEAANSWTQPVLGAWALVGCALVWSGASWLESSK